MIKQISGLDLCTYTKIFNEGFICFIVLLYPLFSRTDPFLKEITAEFTGLSLLTVATALICLNRKNFHWHWYDFLFLVFLGWYTGRTLLINPDLWHILVAFSIGILYFIPGMSGWKPVFSI